MTQNFVFTVLFRPSEALKPHKWFLEQQSFKCTIDWTPKRILKNLLQEAAIVPNALKSLRPLVEWTDLWVMGGWQKKKVDTN